MQDKELVELAYKLAESVLDYDPYNRYQSIEDSTELAKQVMQHLKAEKGGE